MRRLPRGTCYAAQKRRVRKMPACTPSATGFLPPNASRHSPAPCPITPTRKKQLPPLPSFDCPQFRTAPTRRAIAQSGRSSHAEPQTPRSPPSVHPKLPQVHFLPIEPIFPANRYKNQPLTPSGLEPAGPTQSPPLSCRNSRRIRLRFRHVSQIKMCNSFILSMAPTVHSSLPKEKSL